MILTSYQRQEYLDALAAADPDDAAAFTRLLRWGLGESVGLLDEQIARKISCSTPMVRRWAAGSTVPHPVMRSIVYRCLRELLAPVTSS